MASPAGRSNCPSAEPCSPHLPRYSPSVVKPEIRCVALSEMYSSRCSTSSWIAIGHMKQASATLSSYDFQPKLPRLSSSIFVTRMGPDLPFVYMLPLPMTYSRPSRAGATSVGKCIRMNSPIVLRYGNPARKSPYGRMCVLLANCPVRYGGGSLL